MLKGKGASVAKKFELPERVDERWRARLSGENEELLVGNEVSQRGKRYFGINVPDGGILGPAIREEDYRAEIDHWAVLLETTGACESENRFELVNTYDRAKFTFGFYRGANRPSLEAAPDRFDELVVGDERLRRVRTARQRGLAALAWSSVRARRLSAPRPARPRWRSSPRQAIRSARSRERAVARDDHGVGVGHRDHLVERDEQVPHVAARAEVDERKARAVHHHVAGVEHVGLAPEDDAVAVGVPAAGVDARRSCRR